MRALVLLHLSGEGDIARDEDPMDASHSLREASRVALDLIANVAIPVEDGPSLSHPTEVDIGEVDEVESCGRHERLYLTMASRDCCRAGFSGLTIESDPDRPHRGSRSRRNGQPQWQRSVFRQFRC